MLPKILAGPCSFTFVRRRCLLYVSVALCLSAPREQQLLEKGVFRNAVVQFLGRAMFHERA